MPSEVPSDVPSAVPSTSVRPSVSAMVRFYTLRKKNSDFHFFDVGSIVPLSLIILHLLFGYLPHIYVRTAKYISQYIIAAIDKCQSILPTESWSESRSEFRSEPHAQWSAKRSSKQCAKCSAQYFGSAISQCYGRFCTVKKMIDFLLSTCKRKCLSSTCFSVFNPYRFSLSLFLL